MMTGMHRERAAALVIATPLLTQPAVSVDEIKVMTSGAFTEG